MAIIRFGEINEDGELIHFDEPIIEPDAQELMTPPFSDIDRDGKNPWGLPDWRNANEYNKLSDISMLGWRWEFIRRSPSYRALWLKMQKARARYGDPYVHFVDRYEEEAMRRHGMQLTGPQFDCYHEQLGEWLVDARGDLSDIRIFPTNAMDKLEPEAWLTSVSDKNHLLARIDPWTPLGPQLKSIEDIVKSYLDDEGDRLYILREDLREEQTKVQRRRVDKYPLYLRLIDARDRRNLQKASWSEIVKALETDIDYINIDTDSVRRMYRKAISTQKEMVDN